MLSDIKHYQIDYDLLGKTVLNKETLKIPNETRYCIKASDESFDRMYVVAAKVLVTTDGTVIFLNENDEVIVGINPFKYSSFYRVDNNNVPIDVSGNIL